MKNEKSRRVASSSGAERWNARTGLETREALSSRRAGRWFAGVLGILLGLALLKFGNPVVLNFMVERPENFFEYLFQSWPLEWGEVLLALVCLSAIPLWKPGRPAGFGVRWVAWLPLVWLLWQLISTVTSAQPDLSRPTFIHFLGVVASFYLGWGVLSRFDDLTPFWLALILSMVLVLWSGFEQHYGGLENVRQMVYSQPGWQNLPQEYLKKIASNRIFATLVYPNALAGAIILLFPALLTAVWRMTEHWRPIARMLAAGLFAYLGFACFFWTGSKGGWLIAMAVGLVLLLRQKLPQTWKWTIVAVLLAAGTGGFLIQFSGYLRRGAPSASARLEYWRAAVITFKEHPILGTGPGTFSVAYAKIKPPEAEMARLVHNDYLEQASDSGLIGFLLYASLIWGGLGILYRQRPLAGLRFAVGLGLFGWALQQFSEFPLYIPALAWPGFLLLGWALAGGRSSQETAQNRIDNSTTAR